MNQKINETATGKSVTPKKRILFREYLKSVIFLAAIYTLIINQVSNEKTDAEVFETETTYKVNLSQEETRNRQIVLPSLVYSSMKFIFYPSTLLWK